MKKLYRSHKNRIIAGICGGAAEVNSIDPKILRLACVFICLVSGVFPLLVTYLIAWMVIPLSVES
jgi:phage shock protein C